jgi:Domain of unknown function (DUF6249)
MDPATLGVMIPILAIVLGIGLGVVQVIASHRQRVQRAEHRHRERIAAIDKGLEMPLDPPELPLDPARNRSRYLLRGLILVFVGATLTIALWQTDGIGQHWLYGLIPAGVGIAYLIYYFLEGRRDATGSLPSAPRT